MNRPDAFVVSAIMQGGEVMKREFPFINVGESYDKAQRSAESAYYSLNGNPLIVCAAMFHPNGGGAGTYRGYV
jgi:hypothetical protein